MTAEEPENLSFVSCILCKREVAVSHRPLVFVCDGCISRLGQNTVDLIMYAFSKGFQLKASEKEQDT